MTEKKTTQGLGAVANVKVIKEQALRSQFLKLGQIAESMIIRKKYMELFLIPLLIKMCGMSQS